MEIKIEKFSYLTDQYIDLINNLIDFCDEKKILPTKLIFFISSIKKNINENKFEIIQNSLTFILENKETILNFSLESLEDKEDTNDKLLINNINNIYQLKNLINQNNNIGNNELEIINFIIEIKKKAKLVLDKEDILIIKDYIEIMILILEKIKILFN
jgi:hypothetical protein